MSLAASPVTFEGMGPVRLENGYGFRVWAPHATAVSVVGTFNDWDAEAHPMTVDEAGNWSNVIPAAAPGHEYLFELKTPTGDLRRVDPRALQVTNSVGNGVLTDLSFDWGPEGYRLPTLNEIVIYEMHIGTFGMKDEGKPGTFDDAAKRLAHLKRLGVNVVEVMPIAEFAGDLSWGYNPAHPFAVESAYGGPLGFKRFVKTAHEMGIGVILDVVYNHFGPSDLQLWRFDGWSENEGGGIYFYQDWRRNTPWGDTRPDYGRPEVRSYIIDNAKMWLDEYHVDGLRCDMTLYIRSVRPGDPGAALPDGYSITQAINEMVRAHHPNAITIAEDLQSDANLTEKTEHGGGGFSAQWDEQFVHPVRAVLTTMEDQDRSMLAINKAITYRYNDDAFRRVIYTESHDEIANGKSRVTTEIDSGDPHNFYSKKRSTLGAVLAFTSPGVPMIFQGQEFLEDGWFRDDIPLEWSNAKAFKGIVKLYEDLIKLRLNKGGLTRGLTGAHVEIIYTDRTRKIVGFRRWQDGGPKDETVIVVNFFHDPHRLDLPLPRGGVWKLRLNTSWKRL